MGATWTADVSATSVTFHGEVDPEGEATRYRFEYATEAAFDERGFNGAAKVPAGSEASAGSGAATVSVSQHLSALRPDTTYRYRLAASNGSGTAFSAPRAFTTQEPGSSFTLPDNRGWELVSPLEKNGGAIQSPEANHGGGVLQAAAQGGAVTYTSSASFGGYEAQGAPQASQYVSRRSAAGWSTQNITAPALSGSYGNDPDGVPYQLFSPDLARSVMLNGVHCRGEGTGCPVANPPLPGSGAPPGYQDFYLRDSETNSFQALLSETNKGLLSLSSSQFDLAFAGASPDLRHPILSTCAKLTPEATEVPGGEGCEAAEANLYEWSGGALHLLNILPSETHGTPGARLAAQSGAVSEDGSRVYFTELEDGATYLREEGGPTVLVPETTGGAAAFQTATPSGSLAFFTKGGHLFRYDAGTRVSTDLTPSGGVEGVLGASADGSAVYYATASGLFLWKAGTTSMLSASPGAAAPSDYPPATGTARVSADGSRLLFLSKASLTGYDNHDASTGLPDSEVFLYEAGGGTLRCLSCNPTGERPLGPSTIPGAYANGSEAGATPGEIVTDSYKPRNLSASANRAFFTSADALVALDTDRAPDAYQWEAQGTGSCAKPGGCLSLISSGTGTEGATFLDASESGEDAYFLTATSLAGPQGRAISPAGNVDPGSADVYDARVGGGFAEPTMPIACEGDACAPLPSPPEDPTVGSLIGIAGNPPVHFPLVACKKGLAREHGKCVRKHRKPEKRHRGGK